MPEIASMNRRTLLRGGTAAGIALGAGSMPWLGARAADTLTVNGYGAEFQEVFLSTVVQPFENKLGVQVNYAASGMASETYARLRAARGNPGFDVTIQLGPPEILLGVKENLLEKITEADVPNARFVWEESKTSTPPYGVVYSYQYLGLLWHTANVEKPSSWLDYWEPSKKYGEKIRGHVVTLEPSNLASIYALILGAQCKGGGLSNMAPAWDLLREQKPYAGIVVVGMSQTAPYFENGQAWLAPSLSARAGYYIKRGLPIGMMVPTEGTFGNDTCATIPIGATNKLLAKEFINFLLDKETQYNFCLAYQCSPGRPDITDWPADFAASQIVTPAQRAKMIAPDNQMIAALRPKMTKTWQEIMA
jgi:putative spermidine/putrescine transport system substrate-binding protein